MTSTYYLDDTFLVSGLKLKLLALSGDEEDFKEIMETSRVYTTGGALSGDRIPYDIQLSKVRDVLNYQEDEA